MWETAWIIGGGNSLPRQFGVPENVIRQVTSKAKPITAYSRYMKEIHSANVIGVNIAFMLGRWISAMVFEDMSFLSAYWRQLLRFKNLKITSIESIDRDYVEVARNVKRMRRDYRAGLCDDPDMLCWNHNSGASAIDLAAHFGARRIILLGFDMQSDNGRTHWHEGFQNYERKTIQKSFDRFIERFPYIARDARKRGIEILNVNDNSAIKEFKQVKLKDVL